MEHEVIVAEQDREPKKSEIIRYEDYLIDDVVKTILSFLDETSRRHLRLVCTKWFNYINYSVFNIGALLTSEVEEVVRIFGRYYKQIELHFKRDYFAPLWRDENTISPLSKLTNLVGLSIRGPFDDRFNHFTDLTSLRCGTINAETLTKLKKLKTIEFNRLEGIFNIDLPQLEDLVVIGIENNSEKVLPHATNLKHVNFRNFISRANFGRLKHLESLEVDAPNITFAILSSTLTHLVIRDGSVDESYLKTTHLTNLKHLYAYDDIRDLSKYPFLENLSFRTHKPELSPNITKLSNLTYLKICYHHQSLPNTWHYLAALTNLHNLSLYTSTSEKASFDLSFLRSLANNLTSLEIDLTSKNLSGLDTLTLLTALQDLNINVSNYNINFNLFTNLTSLHLRTYFPDEKIFNIGQLTKLYQLTLNSYSRGSSTSVEGFSNLTRLTELDMISICTTESIWREILNLTNLRKFKENQLETTDPNRLGQLTVFKHLTYLTTRAMPGSNIDFLTALTKLQEINIYGLKEDLMKNLPFVNKH